MQKMHSKSLLQRDPIANRPQVIAEMKIAGRLNAGKNSVHWTSFEERGGAC